MTGILYDGFLTAESWPYGIGLAVLVVAGVAGLVWLRRGKRGQR